MAFIYFVALALPMMFLAMAFAVDFTRIVVTNRVMDNAAQAAVSAASWEFVDGRPVLDETRARQTAADTLCKATEDVKMVGPLAADETTATFTCPDGRVVTLNVTMGPTVQTLGGYEAGGPVSVTVQVRYRIQNMIFFRYFDPEAAVDGTATQTAEVCLPGNEGGYTQGHCSRPL